MRMAATTTNGFHFAQRDRLIKAAGDDSNLVMWRGNPVPFEKAWTTFMDWVVAARSDTTSSTMREKTLRNKPMSAVDGCWSSPTEFIPERQSFDRLPSSRCNKLFPSFAFPRYVAGGPLAADIIKCVRSSRLTERTIRSEIQGHRVEATIGNLPAWCLRLVKTRSGQQRRTDMVVFRHAVTSYAR